MIRNEVQVAIRLKQSGKYRYERYRDNGPGGQISRTELNLETAKKQLSLYTKDAEATVVTRKVTINEGPWEEIETSEVRQLAEILHKKQCHWNHIDQCDWEYGPNTHAHQSYEEKAKKILETTTFMAAKELIDLL